MTSSTHIVRSSVVALAAAALFAAPAAVAGGSPQYGPYPTWYAYATPDSAQPAGMSFTTDTLGGNGEPKQASAVRFVTDTLAPGGGGATVVSTTPGFDWGDAGIGVGATLGAVLLAALAAVAGMRRRGKLAF